LQLIALLNEIHDLSQKIGVRLQKVFPNTQNPLWLEILKLGAPSELIHLNGMVVTLGKQHHFPTPLNKALYNFLIPLELMARK
jgi:2-dehydropantoate 2-reductase